MKCVNVFVHFCFSGLPRIFHHLPDNEAGQHASVLHRSRTEVIVNTLFLHYLARSLTLSHSVVAQRKCELYHLPTSYPWNSHV